MDTEAIPRVTRAKNSGQHGLRGSCVHLSPTFHPNQRGACCFHSMDGETEAQKGYRISPNCQTQIAWGTGHEPSLIADLYSSPGLNNLGKETWVGHFVEAFFLGHFGERTFFLIPKAPMLTGALSSGQVLSKD